MKNLILSILFFCTSCSFVIDREDSVLPSKANHHTESLITDYSLPGLENDLLSYLSSLSICIRDSVIRTSNPNFNDFNILIDWNNEVSSNSGYEIINNTILFSSKYLKTTLYNQLIFDLTSALLEIENSFFVNDLSTNLMNYSKYGNAIFDFFYASATIGSSFYLNPFLMPVFSLGKKIINDLFIREWTKREKSQLLSLSILYGDSDDVMNFHSNVELSVQLEYLKRKIAGILCCDNRGIIDSAQIHPIIFNSTLRHNFQNLSGRFKAFKNENK